MGPADGCSQMSGLAGFFTRHIGLLTSSFFTTTGTFTTATGMPIIVVIMTTPDIEATVEAITEATAAIQLAIQLTATPGTTRPEAASGTRTATPLEALLATVVAKAKAVAIATAAKNQMTCLENQGRSYFFAGEK